MTSQARLTAARIAVRNAARGIDAGSLLAARETDLRANAAPKIANAVRESRALVQKSRLARLLNGSGDLWNGDDRAHQFLLLTEAARLRRAALAR